MNPRFKWLKKQTVTLVITGATGLRPPRPLGPALCAGPAQRRSQRGDQPTARSPPGARARAWPAASQGLGRSPPSLLLPSRQADTKAHVFPSFVPTGSSNHISPYFQGNVIPAPVPNDNENPKLLSFLCSLRPFLDMRGASLVSL